MASALMGLVQVAGEQFFALLGEPNLVWRARDLNDEFGRQEGIGVATHFGGKNTVNFLN